MIFQQGVQRVHRSSNPAPLLIASRSHPCGFDCVMILGRDPSEGRGTPSVIEPSRRNKTDKREERAR